MPRKMAAKKTQLSPVANLSPGWRGWIAPVILVTVAICQMSIALPTEMTSWKGGGFGMFADIQQPFNRSVLAWVRLDGKLYRATIPDWLKRKEMAIQAYPTEARLDSLAETLAKLGWRDSPNFSNPSDPGDVRSQIPEAARQDLIVVVAFEVHYDSKSDSERRFISSKQLCRVTQPLTPVTVQGGLEGQMVELQEVQQ